MRPLRSYLTDILIIRWFWSQLRRISIIYWIVKNKEDYVTSRTLLWCKQLEKDDVEVISYLMCFKTRTATNQHKCVRRGSVEHTFMLQFDRIETPHKWKTVIIPSGSWTIPKKANGIKWPTILLKRWEPFQNVHSNQFKCRQLQFLKERLIKVQCALSNVTVTLIYSCKNISMLILEARA